MQIVGMCYAHNENPYSRSEKRIVELNSKSCLLL